MGMSRGDGGWEREDCYIRKKREIMFVINV